VRDISEFDIQTTPHVVVEVVPSRMHTDRASHTTKLPASPAEAALETVFNPHPGTLYLVRFTVPEFTTLCPITGQPDFAHSSVPSAITAPSTRTARSGSPSGW
jgi:hypothetical protein